MFVIHNKNNKSFFKGISPTGRYMFDKFSIENTNIQIVVFTSESEACITVNEILDCGKFPNSDISGIEVVGLDFLLK